MSELPVRLVALDIDGTLVPSASSRSVPERTRRAVRDVVAAGVSVVLVTGRMAAAARPVADALGLRTPLIAHHGAVVELARKDGARSVRHRPLPAATARVAIGWARERGLQVHLNRLDALVMELDDARVTWFETVLGVRARLVPDLDDALGRPPTKVMIAGDGPAVDEAVWAAAERHLAPVATVTTSNARFIEVLAPGVSKAGALAAVASRAGVPLGQVLAIGDNVSDLGLLRSVGHPVAMPHAPAVVLAAAAHVAPPLVEEGAATILERLVLGFR